MLLTRIVRWHWLVVRGFVVLFHCFFLAMAAHVFRVVRPPRGRIADCARAAFKLGTSRMNDAGRPLYIFSFSNLIKNKSFFFRTDVCVLSVGAFLVDDEIVFLLNKKTENNFVCLQIYNLHLYKVIKEYLLKFRLLHFGSQYNAFLQNKFIIPIGFLHGIQWWQACW